jgi:hypothetical protein
VAAVRIEHTDAAAAGDVLQDAVKKEGALAATSRADDVHMFDACDVVDADRPIVVVGAEGDKVAWIGGSHRTWLAFSEPRMTRANRGPSFFHRLPRPTRSHPCAPFDEIERKRIIMFGSISRFPMTKRRGSPPDPESKFEISNNNSRDRTPSLDCQSRSLAGSVFFLLDCRA